jgi:hypothetical protein
MINYKSKYLKYKNKYLNYNKIIGGANPEITTQVDVLQQEFIELSRTLLKNLRKINDITNISLFNIKQIRILGIEQVEIPITICFKFFYKNIYPMIMNLKYNKIDNTISREFQIMSESKVNPEVIPEAPSKVIQEVLNIVSNSNNILEYLDYLTTQQLIIYKQNKSSNFTQQDRDFFTAFRIFLEKQYPESTESTVYQKIYAYLNTVHPEGMYNFD